MINITNIVRKKFFAAFGYYINVIDAINHIPCINPVAIASFIKGKFTLVETKLNSVPVDVSKIA